MRTISVLWLLVAGFPLLSSDFSLLTSDLATPDQERPTFKAESELVVLHVSVRDRGGRYVTGLDKEAFTVIDDGKAQTIEMFSGEDVPASVGLLIDNSNSMFPSRDRVIAASAEFIGHSHPVDEIFVTTFNEAVRPVWGPSVMGDMDKVKFRSTIAGAIGARGMTAIYDGVLDGLRRISHGTHTRQVLIVVSDGDDNASAATEDQVMKELRESDAMVYAVILTDPLMRGGDPGFLKRLAKLTGGEAHQPRRVEELGDAFDRIARDIRSAYTLAYAPSHGESHEQIERKRRAVRVFVRSKDGRTLSVRHRDGYYEKARESSPQ